MYSVCVKCTHTIEFTTTYLTAHSH
uniref:Uncharacterized protein n=1 Tax=Anguilla anguilla TaxID=7936 RepID=A0A0E9VJE3_ANGAN